MLGSGLVDTRKIYVLGGSHGGFLATHLISQYPTTFLAAAVRNPVVNIAANYLTCDIPDWCLSETGTGVRIGPVNDGATSVPSPGNEELLLQMFRASPVAHIDRVQTPLLLLLGKNDVSGPKWNVPCWSYSGSPICLLLLLLLFLLLLLLLLLFLRCTTGRNGCRWANPCNTTMDYEPKEWNARCWSTTCRMR